MLAVVNAAEGPKRDERGNIIVLEGKAFQIIEVGADVYLSFAGRAVRDHEFRNKLFYTLVDIEGHRARSFEHVYPLDYIAKMLPAIRAQWEEEGFEPFPDWKPALDFIDKHRAEQAKSIMTRVAKGLIEFDDLSYIYEKDTPVTWSDGEYDLGGKVVSVAQKSSFFMGRYLEIKVEVLHAMNGFVAKGTTNAKVYAWGGLKEISALPVKILTKEMRDKLNERGRKFQKFATGANFVAFQGLITQKSWWGDRTYRADGRVMVDSKSMQRIDSETFRDCARMIGLEYDNSETQKDNEVQITEDNLYMTWPYLFGFSFRAKQWGIMPVEGMSEIQWADGAFDKLVLDPEKKEMIRALVEHSGGSFSDIVDGKSGGCIFMLHGEPGQGKTLTAETVAELLHRPLYSVSVGELGTNPDKLEDTLREILDIATVWNAVLLLDEADIFLEARDEKDILRNAMVGVFLRLLEYHQGVLFLTTNRIKNIDRAFYSRISMALRFDGADNNKRRKIWTNLLDAAGITLDASEIDKLATHDINGRQIKNVIRLTQTLAKAGGTKVDLPALEKVIANVTSFEKEMAK